MKKTFIATAIAATLIILSASAFADQQVTITGGSGSTATAFGTHVYTATSNTLNTFATLGTQANGVVGQNNTTSQSYAQGLGIATSSGDVNGVLNLTYGHNALSAYSSVDQNARAFTLGTISTAVNGTATLQGALNPTHIDANAFVEAISTNSATGLLHVNGGNTSWLNLSVTH